MLLKIFTQPSCPKCPPAKKLATELTGQVDIIFYDVKTEDGLGEALSWDVMATPSLVLTKNDKEIKTWVGEVPTKEEVLALVKNGHR